MTATQLTVERRLISEARDLIADIMNAADGGEPYSAAELVDICVPVLNQLDDTLGTP